MGKATDSVVVLYASDYGFSDRLSQTVARGITKAGVATEMVDLLSADPQVRRFPNQQGLSQAGESNESVICCARLLCCLQKLVEMVGNSTGIVLIALTIRSLFTRSASNNHPPAAFSRVARKCDWHRALGAAHLPS